VPSSGGLTLRWNDGNLRRLLSKSGDIGRYMERGGLTVESQAKRNASARPGPNVITGRGRSSITHKLGEDGRGVYVDIGTNVNYMAILELQGTYTWLVRAMSAWPR
jgi:hypothetical protein